VIGPLSVYSEKKKEEKKSNPTKNFSREKKNQKKKRVHGANFFRFKRELGGGTQKSATSPTKRKGGKKVSGVRLHSSLEGKKGTKS